jgi:hypothetical protein
VAVWVTEEEPVIAPAQASSAVQEVAAEPSRGSTAAAARRAAPAHAAAPAGEASEVVEALEVVGEDEVEEEAGGAGKHDWKNGMVEEWNNGGAERRKLERFKTQYSSIPTFHILKVTPQPPKLNLMEEEMELVRMRTNRAENASLLTFPLLIAMVLLAFSVSFAATAQQKTFQSAEEAVKAAIAAARSNDDKALLAIFGPQAKEILFSGDAVADKQRRGQFIAAYDERNRLATEGENTILIVGKQDWPFPIPVVKKGEAWVFDTDKGKEEILNRRIGENELNTIQACLAVVDAQREYALKDRDKNSLLEYAQKFVSDPGKRNGLFWEVKQGEPQSPLGPIMIQMRREGYKGKPSSTPSPYHGYFYRILTAQGKNAPGGAYSYLVKGKMIGGFAVVAYPAEYGNSGVMTFIVNHDGKVFQKDLGKNTAAIAKSMKEYNPDKTWAEVKE